MLRGLITSFRENKPYYNPSISACGPVSWVLKLPQAAQELCSFFQHANVVNLRFKHQLEAAIAWKKAQFAEREMDWKSTTKKSRLKGYLNY